MWPLANVPPDLPDEGSPGSFGYKRSFYYHPGVDLYCPPGTLVQALEDGVIVNIEAFTGESADPPSPWWNETQAILIEGDKWVLGYCEIKVLAELNVGQRIQKGDTLGWVLPVLKEDKGNGTSMLHFEMYTKGTKGHSTWLHDEPRPEHLYDPTGLLIYECFRATNK